MKKLSSLTLITFFTMAALSLASPEKEAVVAAEKGAWQSIKEKKIDQFQKMLASDFRGVYGNGINNTDKEVAEVRTLDLKSLRSARWMWSSSPRTPPW